MATTCQNRANHQKWPYEAFVCGSGGPARRRQPRGAALLPRARRRRAHRGHGRADPGAGAHARRAPPRRGPPGQPHHRDRRVRPAARARLPGEQAGLGQLHRAARPGRQLRQPLARRLRRRPDPAARRRPAPRPARCARRCWRPSTTCPATAWATATTRSACPLLRERIAAHYTARGVATRPEQILVTTGSQHAINLVLGTLIGVGRRGARRVAHLPARHRRGPPARRQAGVRRRLRRGLAGSTWCPAPCGSPRPGWPT